MADNSKLEVYKILLGKSTFREVALSKYESTPEQQDDNNLFNTLYKTILQRLTQQEIWTHESTKQGLALFSNEGKDVNTILRAHSDSYIIEGFIDGGPYDRLRMMAEKNNATVTTILDRNKIVTDRYYIFLYLPLNSNVGLFFIERKKGQDIHNPMSLFLSETLCIQHKIKIERYIPKALIDEFERKGIIESFTFTDSVTSPVLDENGTEQYENRYDVSLSIKPHFEGPCTYKKLYEIIKQLNVFVKIENIVKNVDEFQTKKARIQKDKEAYTFSIEDNLSIRPKIKIPDDIHDRDHDVLKHEEAYKMALDLLNQIKDDIYIIR